MLLGSLQEKEKTLTTEKTSMIVTLIPITNTCRVLALYPAVFTVLFYTVLQLTVTYRTAHHWSAPHTIAIPERDTTVCRRAVEESLAQCRL